MGALGEQLKRLGKHSAIYGLGGLVSRILAVLLLPLYTRYLSPSDYGKVETLIALTTVIGIVLRMGIHSAFFRFYFDSSDPEARRLVLRTSFWFTMGMATVGLVAGLALSGAISSLLFGSADDSELVMAAFVGLWAGMNYEQVTSLFRVEERSVAFVSASLTNIFLTIGATLLLVVTLDKGPIGVIVGNFTGTLLVYAVLLGYRREQLGLQFDRGLLRRMNHFGVPLVPTALFLWVTNFSDRLFLVKLADTQEVGLYSVGVRIASALVLLLTAFRLAWPAFAYSIEDDGEARRTYGYVLTYLVFVTTWVATGARAPLALDRGVDRGSGVRELITSRRPARLLHRRVCGVHRRRDRRRAREADAVQLDRDRRRGRGERVAEPASDPALRNDGGRCRHRRGVHDHVRRDGLVGAADLSGAVPMAARCARGGRRHCARDSGEARGRWALSRSAACPRVPARAVPARLLPPGGEESDRRASSGLPARCLIGNWRAVGGGHDQAGRRTHASCRLEACATREGGDPAPCRGRHPARVNFRSSI